MRPSLRPGTIEGRRRGWRERGWKGRERWTKSIREERDGGREDERVERE